MPSPATPHTIETGSRLHFGLLSVADDAPRRFGGAGLMIDAPGVAVRVEPARHWSADGPLAARALEIAKRLGGPPRRVVVERAGAEHAGLGVGTQLSLAIAKALSLADGRDESATALAQASGRGRRSGVGVHGFACGGFLVDGGKGEHSTLAPLLARVDFPEAWRIVVLIPRSSPGLAGAHELAAFAALSPTPAAVDALCRVLLLGLLPALHERDAETFGEALFEFNARSGELFAVAQGGTYASAAVAGVVSWLRSAGARGVGQSSWGPAVFAVVEDEGRAAWLLGRAREAFPSVDAWVAKGRNRGFTASG